MRSQRVAVVVVLATAVAALVLVALLNRSSVGFPGADENLTDSAWCVEKVYDENLAPSGWSEDELVHDCTAALDSGWSRGSLRQAYIAIRQAEG